MNKFNYRPQSAKRWHNKLFIGIMLSLLIFRIALALSNDERKMLEKQIIMSHEAQEEFHRVADGLRSEKQVIEKRLDVINSELQGLKEKWGNEQGRIKQAEFLLQGLE